MTLIEVSPKKFRVWDFEERRLITDHQDFIPLEVTNKGVFRLDHASKEERWIWMPRERFVVMQWAGMADDNGVELYELDKVAVAWGFDSFTGFIRFGEYMQDGSAGEYTGSKCYGFYVEAIGKLERDEEGSRKISSYLHTFSPLEFGSIQKIGHYYEDQEGF